MTGLSLVLLVVATVCHVHGDVQTSTPCSLSFYRYLFNLPGEQIRPNVPEGTYVFGKRVGPASPEGQASDVRPSVLKPVPSYEAPQYLPPPPPTTTTTTTTTTTPRPSTSAPLYIPPAPPSPYYPGEASNTVSIIQPAKPNCEHPEHRPIDNTLVPPYRFEPSPSKFQPIYQQQPTIFVPRFAPPSPQKTVPLASENDIFVGPPKSVAPSGFKYPVPTPPPQFLRPYSAPTAPPTPVTSTTTTTTTTTTPEPIVETRQNEIVVLPDPVDAPRYKPTPDCEHKQHNVVVESLGVPSTDYGVVAAPLPVPSASAGYSYDKPSQPLPYPSNVGYTYPKPSPSFEYPGASPYAAQATVQLESESPKSSSAGGIENGDLVIL